MRGRTTTLLLALAGLMVAVAVGLAANAIASRSFTPGADALPSASSLAPPRTTGDTSARPVTTSTAPKPVTALTPEPVTTSDDRGGGATTTSDDVSTGSGTSDDNAPRSGSGNDSSGKGSGKGDDD